jgi:hypothetical protein
MCFILIRNIEGKRPLWKPTPRKKANNKMDYKEIDYVNWIFFGCRVEILFHSRLVFPWPAKEL